MPWLDLIPRWLMLALLAVAVAACVACRIALAGAQVELARLQATIATERAQAADAGRMASERFRAAERRTAAAGQEITDDTIRSTAAAAGADARAADAVRRLRIRAAALAPRCDRVPGSAAAASDGPAADGAGLVCAELLGRAVEAARLYAAAADARGIAGNDCRRRYEALTPPP